MDSRLFTQLRIPNAEAKGCGSKMFGEKVELGLDAARAEKEGPLRVRESFCSCGPCIRLDLANCEMVSHVGRVLSASAPLAKRAVTRRPKIESLEEWADLLKAGVIVTVRAAVDEHLLEGRYWLAKLVLRAQLSSSILNIDINQPTLARLTLSVADIRRDQPSWCPLVWYTRATSTKSAGSLPKHSSASSSSAASVATGEPHYELFYRSFCCTNTFIVSFQISGCCHRGN